MRVSSLRTARLAASFSATIVSIFGDISLLSKSKTCQGRQQGAQWALVVAEQGSTRGIFLDAIDTKVNLCSS